MSIYTHILCAADFSDLGTSAARRAVELARLCGARLTVLHVVEYFPGERSNQRIAPEDQDPAQYEAGRARERLSELVRELDFTTAVARVEFCENAAWQKICEVAESEHADLLVLGSRGLHAAAAWLGATANAVQQHARRDVLTVHRVG